MRQEVADAPRGRLPAEHRRTAVARDPLRANPNASEHPEGTRPPVATGPWTGPRRNAPPQRGVARTWTPAPDEPVRSHHGMTREGRDRSEQQVEGDHDEPEDGPPAEVRGGTMSPDQARIARHNWIMMHPNATAAERREAEADIFGRITR